MTLPICLQLYTVREDLAKDFDRTLDIVAAIGYTHVEFAGLHNRSAEQARKHCDAMGLKIPSSHTSLATLESDFSACVDLIKTLGGKYLVVSYLDESYRSVEGFQRAAASLEKFAGKLADVGITLGYHNHSFEWEKLSNGQRGIDILFGKPAPYVSELDVFWVKHGGDEPLDWMNKLTGRAPLLHIKDMNKERLFTEVGTGTIDMKTIVDKAPACGAEYLIVEQDGNWIEGSGIESAKVSYNNFKKIVQG